MERNLYVSRCVKYRSGCWRVYSCKNHRLTLDNFPRYPAAAVLKKAQIEHLQRVKKLIMQCCDWVSGHSVDQGSAIFNCNDDGCALSTLEVAMGMCTRLMLSSQGGAFFMAHEQGSMVCQGPCFCKHCHWLFTMSGPEGMWEGDDGSEHAWVPYEPKDDDMGCVSCLCFREEYARFTAGCILRLAIKYCQGDSESLMKGISAWIRSTQEDDEKDDRINIWSDKNVSFLELMIFMIHTHTHTHTHTHKTHAVHGDARIGHSGVEHHAPSHKHQLALHDWNAVWHPCSVRGNSLQGSDSNF